jgi:hypothetical protein
MPREQVDAPECSRCSLDLTRAVFLVRMRRNKEILCSRLRYCERTAFLLFHCTREASNCCNFTLYLGDRSDGWFLDPLAIVVVDGSASTALYERAPVGSFSSVILPLLAV